MYEPALANVPPRQTTVLLDVAVVAVLLGLLEEVFAG